MYKDNLPLMIWVFISGVAVGIVIFSFLYKWQDNMAEKGVPFAAV